MSGINQEPKPVRWLCIGIIFVWLLALSAPATAQSMVLADKVTLGDTSIAAPALNYMNGICYIAWTGTDSGKHLNVMSSTNAKDFTGKTTLGDTSITGPALTTFNNMLYIGWTGTDSAQHLNVMSSSDGVHFSNKAILGDTSIAAPALAVFNNKLYIAWTGTDSGHHLNVMSSSDGTNFGGKVTLGDTSFTGPSLEARSKLWLSWAGTGNRMLNVMSSDDGSNFGGKTVFSTDTSIDTPVIAGSIGAGRLNIAWTGTDSGRHLNVARILGDVFN